MMRYTLDTTTFSLLMRSEPAVVRRLAALPTEASVSICVVVRGEIRYGLARLGAGRRKRALEDRAERLFDAMPCDAVSDAAADIYGRVKRQAERQGKPLGENDLWIAAVAQALGQTLVTADGDFRWIGGLTTQDWSRASARKDPDR